MLASEISRSVRLDEVIRTRGTECLTAFTETLQQSPDNTLETFLEARPSSDRSELAALIAIDLRHQISAGRPCRIEDYLRRFPELKTDDECVLDLIYAEYCERRQHDSAAAPQEYYHRFPDYHKSLERLFRIDSLLQENLDGGETNADLAPLPEAGDTFLEFRLKMELGRGASGRVFLAEQETLSNRHVVVKITPRYSVEHRTLARLDHPNIVRVLSVHHDDLSGLRAVCMPNQCAVSLSDVRQGWNNGQRFPARADDYLKSVAASIPAPLFAKHEEATPSDFPRNRSFVYACAWIMHRLAGALHHAHLRQICHRDLKPSNVLLTHAGDPLLVDFNLSFDQVESGGDFRAFFGGTIPYIPPEQIEALHPIEQGRTEDVGPRSDIYALAATMFQIITGQLPFDPPAPGTDLLSALQAQLAARNSGAPSARTLNPSVPADLDALLQRCLDPHAHRRYESAAQLAEDLDLFLRDRPLRHVRATPLHVRLDRFVRRNRRTLAYTGIVLLVVTGGTLYMSHERSARALAETQTSMLVTTAEKEAEESIAGISGDAYQIFLRGGEYYFSRRYAHAIYCFTRSIELRSDYAPPYFYRARCLATLERDDEALKDFSEAIRLKSDDLSSHLLRAICYATSLTNSDPKLALDDLARVRELLPGEIDNSTKITFLDIARAYSAVSAKITTPKDREAALQIAEEFLKKSLNLGLSVSYLKAVNESDRFRMLDPLFDRPTIRGLIQSD
jgi:serine/threonine protein kinase